MKKNKFLFLFLTVMLSTANANAISLDDVTSPFAPAYRLGVDDRPEKMYKVTDSEKVKSNESVLELAGEAVKNITYADLSLNKIAKELSEDGPSNARR